MTPGYPKPRVRVIPVRLANSRIALADDDADHVFIEFVAAGITGARLELPVAPAIGKVFEIGLIKSQFATLTPVAEQLNIDVRNPRRGEAFGWVITFILSWGQRAKFVYSAEGWIVPDTFDDGSGVTTATGVGIGHNARPGGGGVAIGPTSQGSDSGVGVGRSSNGTTSGAAVGVSANASTNGAALGSDANGSSLGVAAGYNSNGSSNGVALGFGATSNSKDSAFVAGYNSKAQRYREFTKGGDNASTTLRSWSILDWYGDTTDATPTLILLGGTASQRLTVLASSAFMFTIMVIARDNTNNVVSSWRLEGAIKRDASNNTAIVGAVTKTTLAQDVAAATWDIAATADDTNEALVLTVTGAAATTIRWNAMATISEVRF